MLLDTQHVKFGPKIAKIAQSVWKVSEECVWVCEGVCESVWKYEDWVSQFEYMLLDTQHVKFGPKIAKIAQSVWKVREECVWVCEGVCENVWKYEDWVSQFKYMLLDTQHVKLGPKIAKIAQIVWKVWEECVKVCEGVNESVCEYHQYISWP